MDRNLLLVLAKSIPGTIPRGTLLVDILKPQGIFECPWKRVILTFLVSVNIGIFVKLSRDYTGEQNCSFYVNT